MLLSLTLGAMIAPVQLPELRPKGMAMVDAKGRKVVLRGTNLGNWLMLEMWMLALAGKEGVPGDQFELEKKLTERFGEKAKEDLMEIYRSSWITERDFKIIKSYRFNLLRLPLNYRMFESDSAPKKLKPNAWKWVDKAVNLAEKHGMYVILDMHGVQGGQSVYDHTGHSGQNKLWESEENKSRLEWLWTEVAKRYRTRTAVVAYDVKNEPYGGTKPQQVEVFKRVYTAIRKVDPKKLIFAHGHYDGFDHYGSPKANGWTNVGYQMHYYPGLFGNGNPSIQTHQKHIQSLETQIIKQAKAFDAPFLIGEMNVVFGRAGGAEMMRRYYDLHEKNNIMTTMWSYKTLGDEGGFGDDHWGMASNKLPLKPINFNTGSYDEIAAWFRSLGTMPLAVNEKLRKNLAPLTVKLKALPPIPAPRLTAPQETLEGWTAADLGNSLLGGLKIEKGGAFELFGAGSDIWGAEDGGRFLYQSVEGNFSLEVQVNSMEELEQYSKAGLMVRASLDVVSAAVLISTFSSGEVQSAFRTAKGANMSAPPTKQLSFPLQLKLMRQGDSVSAWAKKPETDWTMVAENQVPNLPNVVRAGPVALSHAPSELIKVSFSGLKLTKSNLDEKSQKK